MGIMFLIINFIGEIDTKTRHVCNSMPNKVSNLEVWEHICGFIFFIFVFALAPKASNLGLVSDTNMVPNAISTRNLVWFLYCLRSCAEVMVSRWLILSVMCVLVGRDVCFLGNSPAL